MNFPHIPLPSKSAIKMAAYATAVLGYSAFQIGSYVNTSSQLSQLEQTVGEKAAVDKARILRNEIVAPLDYVVLIGSGMAAEDFLNDRGADYFGSE